MKTILIVEDDQAYSKILTKKLKTAGFNVITSEDGEIALQKIEKLKNIDMILLDIVMPKMDGQEFLYKLRLKHRLKIPIMVLTNLNLSYLADFPAEVEFMIKAEVSIDEVVNKITDYLK